VTPAESKRLVRARPVIAFALGMLGGLFLRSLVSIGVLLYSRYAVGGMKDRLNNRCDEALDRTREGCLERESDRAEEERTGDKTVKDRLPERSDAPPEAQRAAFRLLLGGHEVLINSTSRIRVSCGALYSSATHLVSGRDVPSTNDTKSQSEIDCCAAIWTVTWH
jgi:hypothetical protein